MGMLLYMHNHERGLSNAEFAEEVTARGVTPIFIYVHLGLHHELRNITGACFGYGAYFPGTIRPGNT